MVNLRCFENPAGPRNIFSCSLAIWNPVIKALLTKLINIKNKLPIYNTIMITSLKLLFTLWNYILGFCFHLTSHPVSCHLSFLALVQICLSPYLYQVATRISSSDSDFKHFHHKRLKLSDTAISLLKELDDTDTEDRIRVNIYDISSSSDETVSASTPTKAAPDVQPQILQA